LKKKIHKYLSKKQIIWSPVTERVSLVPFPPNYIRTRSSSPFSSFKMVAMDTCRLCGFLPLFFLSFCSLTLAGKRTLVLLDNANTQETHSIFFGSLKGEKSEKCASPPLSRVLTPLFTKIHEKCSYKLLALSLFDVL